MEALEVAHREGAPHRRRLDHARAGPPGDLGAERRPLVAVQLHERQADARSATRAISSSGALTNTPATSARRCSAAPIASASATVQRRARARVEDHADRPRAELGGEQRILEAGDAADLDVGRVHADTLPLTAGRARARGAPPPGRPRASAARRRAPPSTPASRSRVTSAAVQIPDSDTTRTPSGIAPSSEKVRSTSTLKSRRSRLLMPTICAPTSSATSSSRVVVHLDERVEAALRRLLVERAQLGRARARRRSAGPRRRRQRRPPRAGRGRR